MKKFFVILLIPVFLLATGGLTVNYLYCKGKLTQIGISLKTCCKDVKKGGCCEKKSFQIKLNDNFLKAENANQFSKLFNLQQWHSNPSFALRIAGNSFLENVMAHAPPLNPEPRYIVFHSLII
jgi:hypothetical protein